MAPCYPGWQGQSVWEIFVVDTGSTDRRVVWHPFTQMADWQRQAPLVITHGRGCQLFDESGRGYLDGSSSIWVNLHGHQKAPIDRAIRKQLRKVAHTTFLGQTNPVAVELAERLVALTPDRLTRVFYSDDGSTAVEVALKMAFQYWQQRRPDPRPDKVRFLRYDNAYHGDTVGAVSVGGVDRFHAAYRPLLFESDEIPFPHCHRCPVGKQQPTCGLACLEPVEQALQTGADRTAGLVVEPLVQAVSGIRAMPDGYLSALAELCRRYEVLLIADEVATGFGRTGTLFACEQEQVAPDLMCLSKGITGGYMPLAATLASDVIYQAFLGRYDEFRTFFHGHSYTGNPLGCAAAVANLEVFEKERIIDRIQPRIRHLWKRVRARLERHNNVAEIRGRGLMVGIELQRDPASDTAYPVAAQVGNRVGRAAQELGVLIRPIGDTVVLVPALAMSKPQLSTLVDRVADAIEQVTDEQAAAPC